VSLIVQVKQGSLTDGDETVLVNASNTNGQLGTGVSGAIRVACGKGFQDEILAALKERFGGPMEPGEVLMTDAGTHPRARHVAHVAVMDYREGFTGASYPTVQLILSACVKLWKQLETLEGGPHSVAMVALGAGTGNLGVAAPTLAAAETLKAHVDATKGSRIGRVAFYGYSLPEYAGVARSVAKVFPEVLDAVPADARALITALGD
jgi:O-acetyl-ADP-ribose deacetylase (regulator of RNase III)